MSETKSTARSRLRGLLPHLLALGLAAALAVGITVNWNRWVGGAGAQWTNDAYLQSDLTPLAALVSGAVARVAVDDFAPVRRGDILVEIDPRTYEAQLAQAEANVAAAEAAIGNLHAQQQLQLANIAAATAQLNSAQASVERDDLEATRQERLLASGIAGTQQNVERADAARRISTAAVAQAGAGVEATRRQLAVQQSQEAQLQAAKKASEAMRDLARINLGYATIRAPADGLVGQRRVFPGEYVGVGSQVITVVPLARLFVLGNYKETQITHLAAGQTAEIKIDSFPDARLHGRVVAWAPGTGAQFALLPADNATGNFTKVIQRVPVKVVLDDLGGLEGKLRPGMSAEVTIHTDEAARP